VPIADARAGAVGDRVMVQGTVTVAPGRILGTNVIAIQDLSGGICIALPSDLEEAIELGRVLRVEGVLAAPYGNLELRPARAADVHLLDMADVPAARSIQLAELGESTEGLLAAVRGVVRRIESSASSITLFLEDASGQGRVFIHSAVGAVRAHYAAGQQLEVIGIVGDRLGLYRLWPRQTSDIRIVPPAVQSPGPGGAQGADGGGGSSPAAAEVVSIAESLKRNGQTVAIEGTVTAAAGLLDSDGRRVTMQDGSGAILVRLPAAGATVRIGQRYLVVGQVGSYYGAPQLAVSEAPVPLVGGGAIAPIVIRGAPLREALEWRLATISGIVASVRRDGEAWRAEIRIGDDTVLVTGLSRSGIPAAAIVAGRSATVTGIVKRAHPSATDQRMSIVPRSAADITLGPPAAATGGQVTLTPAAGGQDDRLGPERPADASAAPASARPPDVALGDLAAYEGELVRVGGWVEAVDGDRVIVRDGSGRAAIRIPSPAVRAGINVGDLLNAVGEVRRTDQGGLELVTSAEFEWRVLRATAPALPDPLEMAEPGRTVGDPSAAAAGDIAAGSSIRATGADTGPNVYVLLLLASVVGAAGWAGLALAGRPLARWPLIGRAQPGLVLQTAVRRLRERA
jgi:hypothetical protein